MRSFSSLLAVTTLLALGSQAAQAKEIALSFDLPASNAPDPEPKSPPELPEQNAFAPLPVPTQAANPPVGQDIGSLETGKDVSGDALLALNRSASQTSQLIPPPPSQSPSPPHNSKPLSRQPQLPPKQPPAFQAGAKIALEFEVRLSAADTAVLEESSLPAVKPEPLQPLFDGGPESLVARAVGSAEGTRTPEGHRTPAYFGHIDPGNGAWNLGTFSFQHGAATPEEADLQQLRRLQAQTRLLTQKAADRGLTLSLEETLNGIDLANQAPIAALGQASYIDWLAEAHNQNKHSGEEAILYARTRSFLDPATQRWNAPGLGNTVEGISHDQKRRMQAISHALAAHQAESPTPIRPTLETSVNEEVIPFNADASSPKTASQKEAIDSVIFQLSLSEPADLMPPVDQMSSTIYHRDQVHIPLQSRLTQEAPPGAIPDAQIYQPQTLSQKPFNPTSSPSQTKEAAKLVDAILSSLDLSQEEPLVTAQILEGSTF